MGVCRVCDGDYRTHLAERDMSVWIVCDFLIYLLIFIALRRQINDNAVSFPFSCRVHRIDKLLATLFMLH